MPKGSRIIMVDDDKILVDMYKERLELAGYNVTICRNGEEGLAKIREEKPDIVLLDVMMPKVNGYEALASLKSDPQTKDIPVVMLSALMRDFNREKAVEAGADDYLIKSEAMPADVITKIEQVLQKYGKGAMPAPGTVPPNIPAPQATPPNLNVAPAATPTPPAPPITPPLTASPPTPALKTPSVPATPPMGISDLTPSVKKTEELPKKKEENPAVTPPEKIIFEPAAKETPSPGGATIETEPIGLNQSAQPKKEEIPMVSFNQPAAPGNLPQTPLPQPNLQTPPKAKSPASIALLIILAILLTALINDFLIYYFFILRK